jgi:hypothetical protein
MEQLQNDIPKLPQLRPWPVLRVVLQRQRVVGLHQARRLGSTFPAAHEVDKDGEEAPTDAALAGSLPYPQVVHLELLLPLVLDRGALLAACTTRHTLV